MSQNTAFKRTALAAALSSSLLLAACGGGGGGTTSGGDSGSETYGSIDGTAAKGIIKAGLVTAVELNASGTPIRTVGTGETGADGKYSITIDSSYEGGPIKVSIAKGPNTTMVCDVSDTSVCTFGQDTDLPDGFEMDSVLPEATAGATISAPITPLTHMATSRALASGAVNRAAVQAAISEVNQIVGVNILETEPVDMTDASAVNAASEDRQAYAAFAAGVGLIALQEEGGLNNGLQKLAAAFEDGRFDANEDVTITEIVTRVREEAQNGGLQLGERISSLEARIGEDGSFDPEPLDGGETDIALGKSLVSDVRTWLTSFANLEEPLDGFAGDIEVAGELLGADVEAHAEVLGMVLDSIGLYLDSANPLIGTHTITFTHQPADGSSPISTELSLSIAETGVDNGLVIDLQETAINGTTATVQFNITTNLPAAATSGTEFELSALDLTINAIVTGTDISLSLTNAQLEYNAETAVIISETSDPQPVTRNASLSGALSLARIVDGVTYTFSGDGALAVAKLNAASDNNDVSLESASLEGSISASDGRSFTGSASLTINNAADFDTFGYFDYDSWLDVHENVDGDLLGILSSVTPPSGLSSVTSVEYHTYRNETCYWGVGTGQNEGFQSEVCVTGDAEAITSQITALVQQNYPELSQADNVYFFVGEGGDNSAQYHTHYSVYGNLPDFETAQNHLQGTLSVATGLNLPGLANSQLLVTASRTGFSLGTATASILQDGVERFRLTGLAQGDEGTATAVFTNADGVSFSLSPNDRQTAGVITVNGNTVGTVTDRDGTPIIIWGDGSFESLI